VKVRMPFGAPHSDRVLIRVHRLKIVRSRGSIDSGIYKHCDTGRADGSSRVFPGRLLCLVKEIKRRESCMFDHGRNYRDT
jgi:hypothetical protein